jgi:hypothetical protein
MPKVATDLIIPAKFLKLPNDAIPEFLNGYNLCRNNSQNKTHHYGN